MGPSHELDALQLAGVIVAALPEAVVVTALDRSVLMASRAATELFGHRPGGLPGTAIDELVAPGQRQEVAERERLALGGEEQRFETTVARADGKERAVAVVTTRLVVAGQLIGTVATLRDITDLQPTLVRGARARG
ncbi:MAG TPA: PAS domain S-box protein [Gemmatimonadales bacterium]|nr:PAS domain S-box protein [Gemmatimonadales bacterium]